MNLRRGGKTHSRFPFDVLRVVTALILGTVSLPGSTLAGGPLRPLSGNPRYFSNDAGNPIYLTGSHAWPNLIERNPNTNPEAEPFDFERYLQLLQHHNLNFIRLWSRHLFRYEGGRRTPRCYGNDILYSSPLPWLRTGSGTALDGNPRFDLNVFDDKYFRRLSDRVSAAHEKGIHVSVMLFGGWVERSPQCWRGNPFNSANNSNGIDGDSDGDGVGNTQQLPLPAGVDAIQKAYIRKVIDTVNAFDNVLFEISNESTSDSAMWQYEVINYIKKYEVGSIDGVVRNRHPVGMTAFYDTMNNLLQASPADWISPGGGPSDPYFDDPPAADGSKVSILDSDHVFLNEVFNNPLGGRNWVWKSFTRGHNPILMENIFVDSTHGAVNVTLEDRGYGAARTALGRTREYARRINLALMVPHGELTSTGYALANPGFEYLVYQPNSQGNSFVVDLAPGTYSYEWLEPASGNVFNGQITTRGGPTSMIPPFRSDAVLYLVKPVEAQRRAANPNVDALQPEHPVSEDTIFHDPLR